MTVEIYLWLLPLHVTTVTFSVTLFFLRGVGVLDGQDWPMQRWARFLAPSVDTLLLLSGAVLWYLLDLNPLQNRWLLLKLILIVVYIVLGSFALKRAASKPIKFVFFVAALATVGMVVGIALKRHPLGFFVT